MHPKLLVFIIILLIGLIEFYRGSFKNFPLTFKSIKIRRLLKLLLGFLILSMAMFFGDIFLLGTVQKLDHPFFLFISRAGGEFGRGVYPWLFMIGWYFLALLMRRKSWIATAFGTIFSTALASVSCAALKVSLLRARPNGNLGPFSFFNVDGLLKGNNLFQSFPSGDVVVVAGAAYYLFLRTENRFLRVILFVLPLTTAFSRMDVNRHWPSDVILSLGLGLISALAVTALTLNGAGSSKSGAAN